MTKLSRPPPVRQLIPGHIHMPPAPTQTYRLARLEALVETMQRIQDVQFKRIAQLQAQLDRAIASSQSPDSAS